MATKKPKKTTPKPKVKAFTVDRSTWINGQMKQIYENAGLDRPNSMLLNDQGQMCCLGFYAQACGIPRNKLDGVASPESVNIGVEVALKRFGPIVESGAGWSGFMNSELASDLMAANDKGAVSPKRREQRIARLFKKGGIKVKFIGEYPTPESLK